MIGPSWTGRLGSTRVTGTCVSRRIDASTDTRLLPSKGRRPVSISYSRTPIEKMSERRSAGWPLACSGDM